MRNELSVKMRELCSRINRSIAIMAAMAVLAIAVLLFAKSHNLTIPQSHNLTISQSHNSTISQSHNPTISQSHNPTISQSHNSTIARVISVDDSQLQTHGLMRYGEQVLEVEILEGERKGERFPATNIVRAQMELDKFFAPGDTITVALPLDVPPGTMLTARDHWRIGWMAAGFGTFALLLVALGGWVGFNALVSFAFSCFVIWRFVVPMALKGMSASLVAFAATAILTAAIMFLVGGLTRKALAAFGGAMLGVAAGLGIAHFFGATLRINGATLPFVQTLVYSGFASLDLADVFIAATILAASGAMMDLAMDIAAGVCEVSRHNPALGFRELFRSGLRIGRATVGTMTTTLLLAYSGGYLTLLMVFHAQGTTPLEFISTPIVAAEVVKTLVGSLSIVLVAPFTALFSAILFSAAFGAGQAETRPSQLVCESERTHLRK